MKLKIADIVSATGGKLISGNLNAEIKNISTDTRTIEVDSFFVALKGENFDGNDFIVKAKQLGASGCLMQKYITDEEYEEIDSVDFAIIKVEDTLKGLGQIASAYRRLFEGRVCAVTGSVGKTSTKEMISAVLSRNYTVRKTEKNKNNEIGMPMTILELKDGENALVLEMGMRGFNEIDYLAEIAKPDVGVVTNIGYSHIERLGSRKNIFHAKTEMIRHIKQGGYLVINADDKYLDEIDECENISVIKYGIENCDSDVYADNINIGPDGSYVEFEVYIKNTPCEIYNARINVPGRFNVYNALCAVCTGMIFQMNMSDIIDGIGEYRPADMRQSEIISKSGFKIINSTYNASPDSMIAALGMLEDIPCEGKKIAVLGDMYELGEMSEELHNKVGEYFSTLTIDRLVTIGELGKNIADAVTDKEKVSFLSKTEAAEYIIDNADKNDVILVKASRGLKLEEIVSILEDK